jgi:hypothetical protein
MKKKILFVLPILTIAAFSLVYFSGCSKKNSDLTQTSIKSNDTSNPFSPSDYKSAIAIKDSIDTFYANERRRHSFFRKFWNWLVAHSGQSLGGMDCGMSLNCGPCPGICLGTENQARPIDSLQALAFVANNDSGVVALKAISTTSTIIRFLDTTIFVKNDTFFLPNDLNLGAQVADSLGVSSITLLHGVYPMVTSSDGYRETLVNINL